jgi:hypothetical protein
MRGSPAFSRSGSEDRFLRLVGFTSVPFSVAKTKPWSYTKIAEALYLLHLPSEVASECLYRRIRELSCPAALFGLGLTEEQMPLAAGERSFHSSKPSPKSKSSHLRPSNSPCLSPVVTANTYSASKRSPCAASSRVFVCSLSSGFVSSGTDVEALTYAVTLRGIKDHFTA